MNFKIESHVNSRGMITIPIHIRKALDLRAGTEVLFSVNRKNQIIITRKESQDGAK